MSPKQKKTVLKDLLELQRLAVENGTRHAIEVDRYLRLHRMITERIKALKGGKE